ncbi:MAG: hypothetical protein KGJ60_14670 [Verrucomicrobiota bacterium]|nr:hypothetical protein [Verrucomicrobiota bacterium]
MKDRNSPKAWLVVAATMAVLGVPSLTAQDTPTNATAAVMPAAPAIASQTAPELSYGVPEVLSLSRAKVSDDVIVNYIQNSHFTYGLDASQIIYLRQQGVSDRVITTMLNQRGNATPALVQPVAAPAGSQTGGTETYAASPPPTVTYVQTVPSSTVYVIPDTQAYNYNQWYYYNSPYYYGYYAWPYPAVSFSFGFGGYYGGYHHGGYYRGGDYHGGGFHGGGGWGYHGGGHHR